MQDFKSRLVLFSLSTTTDFSLCSKSIPQLAKQPVASILPNGLQRSRFFLIIPIPIYNPLPIYSLTKALWKNMFHKAF